QYPMIRPAIRAALLATALLMLFAGTAFAAVPASPAAPSRALWVWNTAVLRHDPEAARTFFGFLAAPGGHPDRAITTVFLDGMRPSDFADPATVRELRAFLAEARGRRHLRVDFLCGAPEWGRAANHETALANLRAVLAFNKGGGSSERFDGIQYDVEPYIL